MITAVATVAIVVVGWLQWKTLGTTEQILKATQRPWIGAKIDPVELLFNDAGATLYLRIAVKNTGGVPGTQAFIAPVFIKWGKKPREITDVIKETCRPYGIGDAMSHTLFKDDILQGNFRAEVPRNELGKTIDQLLAVCIPYRFAASREVALTGYLFKIATSSSEKSGLYAVETKNGTIAAPPLILDEMGSYSD